MNVFELLSRASGEGFAFLGGQEYLLIFVLILLLFGGKKIPELMRGVGKGVGELQKGLEEGKRTLRDASTAAPDDEPVVAAKPAPNAVAKDEPTA